MSHENVNPVEGVHVPDSQDCVFRSCDEDLQVKVDSRDHVVVGLDQQCLGKKTEEKVIIF